jgi:hypothetical protein
MIPRVEPEGTPFGKPEPTWINSGASFFRIMLQPRHRRVTELNEQSNLFGGRPLQVCRALPPE